MGGKFPLSTYLAERVREMLADPKSHGRHLPPQVRDWLAHAALQVAWCPRAQRNAGRRLFRAPTSTISSAIPSRAGLAHQTLGMLLTRRLERGGLQPLGFVASEYALVVWSGRAISRHAIATGRLSLDQLFDEDMMGDDLDAWLAESNLMKRTFRNAAIIAGLIERR